MNFKGYYIVFLVTSVFIFPSCSNKNQATQGPPAAIPVTVTQVASTNAIFNDEYPAMLSALDEINLTSQVTGYITGIYFKDGQKVKKGQKLYSIDAQVYQANYQQAMANLQVQESNLLKSQKDADRYHELDKHDAIAKQQVDYADAALEASKKQVAAAKANLAGVQSNVKFATIYAPFNGTIGISQVKKGTSVVAGQSILNTVSTDNPVAVDFTVDQKDIYHFIQIEQARTVKQDSTFTIAFGTEVYPYPGHISVIDRAVDPQTGTIKVRLVFPNDKHMLKPGMNTTVRVKNTVSKESTIIPYKAVTELLGEFFVYVVGDSSKVIERKIALGKQFGDSVIIKDGIKEGETIVVQGVQNLHDGSVITTKK